jgi:hypothetical protein
MLLVHMPPYAIASSCNCCTVNAHSHTATTLVAQSTAVAESTARGVQLPRFEAAEFQRTWKFVLSYFWFDCFVCWLAFGLHRCLADWTFKWNMVLNTMLLVHAVGWWPEGQAAAHLYIVCMSLRVMVSCCCWCCCYCSCAGTASRSATARTCTPIECLALVMLVTAPTSVAAQTHMTA